MTVTSIRLTAALRKRLCGLRVLSENKLLLQYAQRFSLFKENNPGTFNLSSLIFHLYVFLLHNKGITMKTIKSSFFTVLFFLLINTSLAQDSSTDYSKDYQLQALDIFRECIKYRTAKNFGQVPKLADYLAGLFRKVGFAEQDIHILPLTFSSGEKTASLVVRYRGDSSAAKKAVLFLAHMDVVDALPEDWERDPFKLIEEDGYFYGRGTSDNKMGVVMLTQTFLRLKKEGFIPDRDLIIIFTGDEETDQLTITSLVNEHRALIDADFCLNTDAGGGSLDSLGNAVAYDLQTSEKTYATFELTIRNRGGHSSRPRLDNAIYELAKVLNRIEAYRFPVMYNETTLGYFRAYGKMTEGLVGEAMQRFADDPYDSVAADILFRTPWAVGMTRTTIVATMLKAGHAENALPQKATATVNCRIFPGTDVSGVRAALEKLTEGYNVEIKMLGDVESGPISPLRDDVLKAVTKAVNSIHPGMPIVPYMSSGATDGKILRIAGIPTYGTSGLFAKHGDLNAHGEDEKVPVRSFFDSLDYWYLLTKQLSMNN